MSGNVNAKGRRKTPPFAGIPKAVLETEKYRRLAGWDVKLLLDLVKQYNGKNNGDLSAEWSKMRGLGWRSKGTLYAALSALQAAGFIEVTRQGGRHKPTLFAITWQPVDEIRCPRLKTHKLDVKSTTVASGKWKDASP